MKEKKKKRKIKLRNIEVKKRIQAQIKAGTIKETAAEKKLLMSVDDLRELLLCCDSTVRKLLAKGLPYYRLGRVYRFDQAEVLAWIKQNGEKLND